MKHAIVAKLRQLLDRISPQTPRVSPKEEAWDDVVPLLLAVTHMSEETSPEDLVRALVMCLDRLTAAYEIEVDRNDDLRALVEAGMPRYSELMLREYIVHQPLWEELERRQLLDSGHERTLMGLGEVRYRLGTLASAEPVVHH